MNQSLYVGIDVSKAKLDVALTHNGKEILSHATFENNLQGFKKLTSWTKKQSKKFEKIHYCMEATGIYSEEIANYLQDQKNSIVSVVNPVQPKAFAGSLLLRTKNDRVDAGMIACYAAMHNPPQTPKVPEDIKEFKRLVRHLNYLINSRAKEKTKLESIKSKEIALLVKETIAHYNKQIVQVEKYIKTLINSNPELKESIKLVDSVPSIGYKTACNIIAEIHYTSRDNLDVKSEIANAGLSPQEKLSGISVKGKSKICKKGNSYLRGCLYMPAMSAISRKSILGDFYRRLIDNKKLKMVALVAVMKKMLAIAIGVLKNHKPFNPNWSKLKQEEFVMAY
jgi:transposase